MFASFYEGNSLLILPQITLVLFVAVFTTVVFSVWRRGEAKEDIYAANLPLREETPAAKKES